jgi:SatD family (SatD)
MAVMKAEGSGVVATLIGDVVGSRAATDRSVLHGQLVSLLAEANERLRPAVPLRVTVGDEYQGCFETTGEALHATLWLPLHLAPQADVRHGVGWGSVAVLADDPRVEDGPGWWAARAAIESVKADSSRAAKRHLRTSYHLDGGTEGPDPGALNAALLCRDQMVGSLTDRSLRLLRGMVDGYSQAELAASEGVSASAVSQRVRRDGLAVIVQSDELLRGVQ